MEKENVKGAISNAELEQLIRSAKEGDETSMNRIIELYKEDIEHLSKYIKMSKEDSFHSIVVDFIEFLVKTEIPTLE